ncbi:MAG: hypothetical protein AMXMBFR80_09660 [Dehalococcoidia bacterium]
MGRRRAANDPSIRTALTDRQREVLALMARGRTNAEIANQLGLSLEGAKWHVREIFGRLGVDSREEAVRLWREQQSAVRRVRGWLGVGGGVALAGTATVATAAGVFVVFLALGGIAATSGSNQPEQVTTTAVSPASPTVVPRWQLGATKLQQQPGFIEIESGDQWRLLQADDGSTPPHASEAILAIDYEGPFQSGASGSDGTGSDLIWPHVDVIGRDGHLHVRVETGYRPMARLNPADNTLIVSDVMQDSDGGLAYARVLVFALDSPHLLGEVRLPHNRVNFTTFGNAITLSPDGQWLYWIEHGQQSDPPSCEREGDESVCDLMTVHAVDLMSMANSSLTAHMPRACGVPDVTPYQGSSVLATCHQREASRLVIDAAAPEQVRPGPVVPMVWSRVGNVGLRINSTNSGSLTEAILVDMTTGEELARQPLPEAFGIILLDERTALVHLANGSLHHLDLYTGETVQQSYSLDAGPQGLSVVFQR